MASSVVTIRMPWASFSGRIGKESSRSSQKGCRVAYIVCYII